MHNTYLYILANDGIETSNSYPFQGRVWLILLTTCISHNRKQYNDASIISVLPTQQSSCVFNKDKTLAQISGSVRIPSGSESDLLEAVATAGPVAVAVDASSKAFRVHCNCNLVKKVTHKPTRQ